MMPESTQQGKRLPKLPQDFQQPEAQSDGQVCFHQQQSDFADHSALGCQVLAVH
jgi:hypothetical protein